MQAWHEAALTTLGLFWTALWAFGFGYLISSMIQVFVTRERMRRTMGDSGPRSMLLATFFGFLSSSCSFAALATARALFVKGAGFTASLAFLLASTNLVIELGIVIAVFLGWQFVVGEYAGGLLLIAFMWGIVRLTASKRLVRQAREHACEREQGAPEEEIPDWRSLIASLEGWRRVAKRYVMEWKMVWKDVTIGFTLAGIIAVYVPRSFFQSLFIGTDRTDPAFLQVVLQTFVAPLAAFFTFIGSMGNIPLAAVLYDNGVSFAGIMAFIFSDLVVLPVLRIQAKYYGWRVSLYIAAVFLVILIASALVLHYGLLAFDALPDSRSTTGLTDRQYFAVDHTLFINLPFILISGVFLASYVREQASGHGGGNGAGERIFFSLALVSLAWLGLGLLMPLFSDLT